MTNEPDRNGYRLPHEANSPLLQMTQGCRLPKHKRAVIEAVRWQRERLRRYLDAYPKRAGESSILNRS